MVSIPPLPLSQQIIAWVLGALGHADKSSGKLGVSTGTIKNAKKGIPIPSSWEDLLNGVLKAVHLAPEDEPLAALQASLHWWDEKVSALPPSEEFSLAERLHEPLLLAVPLVGLRLGAFCALLSRLSNRPIDDWMWVASPFDKRFFGKVVCALLEKRFPNTTNEEKREQLENAGEDKIVDWRTIERWRSGDSQVPNVKALAPLGRLLGPGAEFILRVARMIRVLRDCMGDWIGDEEVDDWARYVTTIAEESARALASSFVRARLLRWFCDDLDGPHGDHVRMGLQPVLLGEDREASRAQLSTIFAASASRLEADYEEQAATIWLLYLTILKPDLRFSMQVCQSAGTPMMGALGATDLFHQLQNLWLFRKLMKAFAEGEPLSSIRPDGRRMEHVLSNTDRAVAQRWCADLKFSPSSRDPDLDDKAVQILIDLSGGQTSDLAMLLQAPSEMLRALLDPQHERLFPQEFVCQSRALCLARARRLAEEGDSAAAFRWLHLARSSMATPLGANSTLELETLTLVGHLALDEIRPLRAQLRDTPNGNEPAAAVGTLLANVKRAEDVITTILKIGEAPEGSHSLLVTLVAAAPVALRVALLREELAIENEGYGFPVTSLLLDELAECLEQQRTHGQAWAIHAMWLKQCEMPEAAEAEKNAIHYGAAEFSEHEARRIQEDLGLTEDAG